MNEIVNTFLLAEDKFMSEIYLRQPGFIKKTKSFIKKKVRIKKLKEIGDLRYIFIKAN